MSTLANRPNNYASVPLSESDNDDDIEQDASYSQQNESMMHKVKDVVTKLLNPSFLFAANGGDTSRTKRKRSIEENGVEPQAEPVIKPNKPSVNGHSISSKLRNNRPPPTDDEPQLTDDDEDSNGREVLPVEPEISEIEQLKKRRRTANYQHMISTTTTTTNGHHEEEKTLSSKSTNNVEPFSHRRIVDNGVNTTDNTTPSPLEASKEQNSGEENNRLTSTKQRFNISSNTRPLLANYQPSQSPLFSISVRKTNETTMSPNRTTTNLKSNTNEFSSNYLLATGLANRPQVSIPNTPQSNSTLSNRLLSTERQVLGVNYSSINSRRLPYIERLRRRTLQDCIRLNRTLDSEPLSISTIEEHTSSAIASPVRKPVKVPEKECGIQCNISTTDSSMEPSRKIPRTFPPPDIRNEALSVPSFEKPPTTSQTDSNIETNSSITIEPIKPINDINKPKVIGNIVPFSWPKFARAQEDFAKKYPEKCRLDAIPPKPAAPIEKPSLPSTVAATTSSTISQTPIFGLSPPRSVKPSAGPIWKCPSCSMEHPAQTASCSVCHGINPNYKRLSALEPTATIPSEAKVPETIVEQPTVSKTTTTTTVVTEISTTKQSTFSIASTVTATATTSSSFSSPITFPTFGSTSTSTTKEIVNVVNPPSSTPLFGTATTTTTTSDKPVTSTPSNSFSITTSTPSTFPTFGSFSSSSSSTLPTSITAAATTAVTSTPITFGSFAGTPTSTVTNTESSTTAAADKPPLFTFGSSPATSAITPSPSTSLPVAAAAATTTASVTSNLFAFSSNTTATATTSAPPPPPLSSSLTFPTTATAGGFSFPSATPLSSTSLSSTTSAAPLFGSSSLPPSSSGFNFTSAATTTTASNSTPFAFGASSPPKPFAPSVISTTNSTTPTPAFGATASFGTPSSTIDKPSTSIPSFSTFGSTAPTSFAFGATSNPVSSVSTGGFAFSPATTSAAPLTSTSGFSFNAPTSTPAPAAAAAAAPPAFGSAPSSFAFGSTPSFSFGSNAPPTMAGNAPFQFTGLQSSSTTAAPVNTSFSAGFPAAVSIPENNPFSVSEDSANKRPVIKAKRRAKP